MASPNADARTLTTALTWVGGGVAVAVTVVVVALVIRSAPFTQSPVLPSAATPAPPAPAREAGVTAILRSGDVVARRRLPALAFALEGAQTLDAALPPGPFEGEFAVSFNPGPVRRAMLGARVEGGSVVIERDGATLASGQAGADPATVLTETVFLPGRLNTFTYRFKRAGDGPARLIGLWEPQDSQGPVPLPAVNADGGAAALPPDPVDAGYALLARLNCVACHRSDDPSLQAELSVNPAPILGAVGSRVRPAWMGDWIRHPQQLKPGAGMPALFGGDAAADADTDALVADLTHFLVSLGGPMPDDGGAAGGELVATGRVLYHRIGCAACHGPRGDSQAQPDGATYTPLGDLSRKTTPARLAEFLLDPVAIRPGGRMPAQSLTPIEAEAIAAFLIRRAEQDEPTAPLHPEPKRVSRGQEVFASRGCANCHALGPDRPTVASVLEAPSLEQVAGRPSGGCLAASPPSGTPDFGLARGQRDAIAAFLESLARQRGLEAPHRRLAAALDRFNCLACHTRYGEGGPGPDVAPLFATVGDVDLGDEGRLPPDLGGVGARLNPQWLAQVLTEHGVARPYMATRMPQYGADNVAGLPALFAATAGMPPRPDHGPAASAGMAESGRRLVGSGGFNCIQCHVIADRDPSDLPGPDLARMPQRLRFEHFREWVGDPKLLRPGTRMPSFFYGGRSGLLDELDGDAGSQIAAIWAYLSQGDDLPLPDGLTGPESYALAVEDRPIVFRTFMKDVGPRAIACGFPEQVHYAFDAGRCAVRLVWTGRFLGAQGAWAARGGSETNPDSEPAWISPDRPVFSVIGAGVPVPAEPQFRGYRLADDGRPDFLYSLHADGALIEVTERTAPRRRGDEVSLLRRFELTGPPGTVVGVELQGHRIGASGAAPQRDRAQVTLDGEGRAILEAELRW